MLEAQELLLASRVAMMPHMKEESRAKIHRQWHRLAYPDTHSKPLTTRELSERIGALVNGQ